MSRWDEIKKKKIGTTSDGNGSNLSRWDKIKSTKPTISSDGSDIQKFIDDYNSFAKSISSDYSSISYGSDYSEKKTEYAQKASELNSMYSDLMTRYNLNRSDLTKEEEELKSYLNNIRYSALGASNEYGRGVASYSSEGVEARKEDYRSKKTRLEGIEEELPWIAKTFLPNWAENVFLSKDNEALRDEAEALEAEINKYERTQGVMDKYYTPVTEEFEQNASHRDYTNASEEELWEDNAYEENIYNIMANGGRIDDNGNVLDAGGHIKYTASELTKAIQNNTQEEYYNSLVQDKLGMFLSADDDTIARAYNTLTATNSSFSNTWAELIKEGDINGWKYLEEYEIKIYYDLLKREGQASAYKFLEDMTTELTRRETQAREDYINDAPLLEQIALNIASVPMNVFGGAVGFIDDASNIIQGKEINPYSRAHSLLNDASAIRSDTASDISNATGNVAIPWLNYGFGDAYQAVMSSADSLLGAATLGSTGYGILMGMGAASSEMKDLYEKGASTDQMLAGGILAGAAEMVFEKYSIDQLVKMGDSKTLKSVVINTLKQGGVEASEEMLTEIANTITNGIVMGSQSDWVDAETFAKNVANAGLSGFISGGGMGGVYSTANKIAYDRQVKKHGQSIIDEGGTDALKQLALDMAGVNQNKQGQKIVNLVGKVEGKASAKNVGKLSAQMQDTITTQNKADIQTALVKKGLSEKDAKRVTEYLASGETLTAEQRAEIESNDKIKAVVDELLNDPNSSISERTRKLFYARLGVTTKSNTASNAKTSGELSVKKATDVSGKVSESGKTIIDSTGESVTINKNNAIAKTKMVDGERVVYYNTDKGVVASTDIKYANESEGLLYEAFVDMNPAFANAVIKNYDGSAPIQTYINGMREGVIVYGMHNFQAVGKDISGASYLAELSKADQDFALKLGRAYAKSDAKKATADLRQAIRRASDKAEASKEASSTEGTKKTPKKGGVSFENGAKATTKAQKRIVSLSKHLASAIGINIVFYDATIKGTFGSDSNGYFDEETNTVHIDLQKAKDDAKTIAFTLSHELVHFIKKHSPDKFNTFANFLMEQYAEHGVDSSKLLANKMAELGTTDADFAYEEMICDACETMLLDSNAVVKLMELRKQDLNLFETIKLHILELLNKIREEYRKMNYAPTSDEARALLKMEDVLDKLHSMFEDAIVDATKNYQAAENVNKTIFGESTVDVGKTESGVKHQLKAHKEIGEASIAYNDRHKAVSKAILKVGVESMYEMAEAMLPYLEEEGILPPDIPGKTIFKNGSYGKTGENTTLCVRTLTYEDFKDRVAEEVGRPLTVSESLLVSQKIYDIATEPQCIYCYVAADRKAYDEYLGEYWKAMDKYIKAMRDGGDSQALYTEYLAGRKDTSQQKKRWSQWETIAKSGKEYITAKDLTTKRTRERIIARKNALSEQIKDAQRYAQSASWAKTVCDYRAYKGDILKMTAKFVDMLNSEYGLRMYSFSDYTPAFIVENMQMIIDASVKGLKSLAYTKDTDYVEIFASTGQAINVSCFAKWDAESGTYVEDNRQGANWEKTKNLRKQYRNVGAVMVATNDAMVEWALKQDWVDVVIPYHIVKTGTTIANEYQWNNYTSESADRAGGRTANIYPTEHNNDFATYSNLLNERGVTPRFSRWYDKVASGELTEDQYMKLVNEVRLPASELSPVVPSFNLEAAKKSFGIDNEGKVIDGGFVDKGGYMGGWYRQGVDVNQEVMAVSEDIKAGKSSLDVDYGMSKAGKERVEERYKKQAKKKNSDAFVEDKYFRSQMQKWGDLSRGSYVKVGEIKEDHPLVRVGMPQGTIKYDVDKLNKNMAKHEYLNSNLLEAIPSIIADPIAISEYGQDANTVSVFGDVFVGSSPMMVGVTIAKDRSGASISKVRTYNARRDVGTLITDDTVLYLNEDKKRTRTWFQVCGIQVPLGETKFGFIRSISQKEPSVKKQLKKTASTQYAPIFYSLMGREIDAIKTDRIGASSLVNYLKGKGVKHDEIKWSGIETFLEGKKSVTKAELQEFVAGSQLQIVEQTSGEDIDLRYDGSERAYNLYDSNGKVIDTFTYNEFLDGYVAESDEEIYSNGIELEEALREEYGITSAPRWAQYKLDGGTNYRELIFQLPNATYSNRAMRGHWGQDAEGILVHARIQDFDVEGKKMLFIEELQSDWHNEGLQKGYSTEEYEDAVAVYDKLANEYQKVRTAFNKYVRSSEFRSDSDEVGKKKFDWLRGKVETAEKRMQDAERYVNSLKEKGMGDVADAPFRSTYHEYVLKRLLRMAAEEGYDSIGWTPSGIQSDRWSDEYAEAYRIEYDQDMPKFLRKYGKKWGATVGETTVNGTQVWSMDITEPMKQSVLYEGQAKFQKKKVSNRTLLANALDSIAQNDIEKNKLKQYKDKIALIENEQAKLAEIRAKANELRFTKGRTPAETKQMRDLDFEANQIANRISTYDKQLLNLESTAALKGVLEREKVMLRKKLEQKGKESLNAYKEKAAKTQRELLTRYQESRAKAIEGRNKTEMRHKIKKVVSDLNKLLLNPTKEQHVPIGLQLPVAEALDAINMDTMNAEERVAYYNDLIAKSSDPDEIEMLTKKRDFFEYRDANFKERITALKNAYAEFKRSEDPLIKNAHNEAIEDLIENTANAVGSKSLKDMSIAQLETVYDMYKAVLATVRNSNKMFKEGRQATVTENSESVKVQVKEAGGHRERVLKLTKFFKKFGWNMLKPVTAMKVIGSKTFAELFDNVRAAEDTWAVDINEAKEFYKDVSDKYGYNKWDFKTQHDFKDSRGEAFSISLEQMLSLYAYSKREQADEHLEFGGFIFDDAIEVTEKNKLGIPLKYEVNDANPHRLGTIQIMEIIGKLTKEQRAFVDEMQTYLSEVMGEKGNEVSLALYDIKLYKEKNYFPLKTARYFREFDPEKSGTPKIKNSGFSKKTVPQAGNPIVLSNFMDVWAGHVNDMSMYHAFVLPLEDFMRVYNYSSTAGGYDSVQQYIKNAYGSQANQYIEKLMDDLNGGARVDPSADVINKGISLFKKASVFASASVVVQQPSAIARAFAYINPKYFVTSSGSALNIAKHKSVWAEVKKYAPVAVIKEMGYFDTGMGRSTVEWLKGNQTVKDKVDDVLSKAPAMADELSWSYIWLAVKNEVKSTSNLKVGSEEFLKKCGQRFTEIITNTQVYDSVLSRSGMMRSKDTGMKMATAFMAEPTTTVNMIVDGIIQGKRGNKRFTAATVGAVSSSIILNSILVSLVYAARDDDEDETYAEKYIGSLTSELIDGFNPLTYIPFVKDMWSIAQGYDVERSDMSVVSDLWKTVEGLFNEDKSGWEKVSDASGAVASLFGLPLKNIIRDAKGMYNLTETILSDTPTTKAGIADSVEDAVKNSIPLWDRLHESDTKSDKLYEAIMSGDQAHIERVKSRYDSEDDIDSALRKEIRERYVDGELTREEAMSLLAEHGGVEGDEAYWKMQEWDFYAENGTTDGYSKYNDFYEAVRTGKNLKAVIKEYTDNGVKTSTLASQITSYYKPLYKEMSSYERACIKGYLLNAYALLGYNRTEKSKDIDNWLKD